MNVLEKILEEIEEATFQEDAPIYIGNMEVDGYVRASRVKEIIRSDMESISREKDMKITRSSRDNGGWIPVEERLPEVPEENPIFDNKPLELYLVDIGAEYPIRAFWNGREFTDGWSLLNVIAWQPLPEPYSPERAEKKHKNAQQEIEDFWLDR